MIAWVAAALAAAPIGFDPTIGGLDLGPAPPRSARCGACHPQEHADWAGSRHRTAWSNDLFVSGYAVETLAFCVGCHAPLPQQAAEIRANRAWYRSLDPLSGLAPGAVERLPEPSADEGIGCAVCHWRDGVVLSAEPDGVAAHAVRAETALATSEWCISCHDFPMPSTAGGVTTLTDVAMQSTGAEWRAWGGEERCQDCHMPEGRHVFRGPHDVEWLRRSVGVDVERDGPILRVAVRPIGVGHRLPSGDLFRRITVEVDGAIVATFGRSFAVVWDDDGKASKELVTDTTLAHDEVRVVEVRAARDATWSVSYRYGSPDDEARGLVPVDELVAVLAASGSDDGP